MNDTRGVLLGVLTPIAAVVAGIAALLSFRETRRQNERLFKTTRDQLKLARDQLELSLKDQVNERFSRAIAQLGNGELDVRVGSIYALEQIARDAPGLHWPSLRC